MYISVGVYKFSFTQFLNLVLIGSCNSKLNKTLWTYMYVLPIANGSYQFGRHDHLFWKKMNSCHLNDRLFDLKSSRKYVYTSWFLDQSNVCHWFVAVKYKRVIFMSFIITIEQMT